MSEINTLQSKSKKYRRVAAWILAVVASLTVIAYFGVNEYSRYYMQALNRKTLSSVEFDKYLSEALSAPAYVPEKNESTSPVHFDLNLGMGLPPGDGTLVFIDSSAIGFKLIYGGPYQKNFTIQAGKKLLGANYGDGGDNFTISIVHKSTRQIGTGVIESIRPWQADKTVHIQLLPFRETNAIGEPESFKVRID